MSATLDRPIAGDDAVVLTVDERPRRRRLGPGPRRRFAGALGPLLLLAAWAIGSWTGFLSPQTLSPPWTVVETAQRLIEEGRLQSNLEMSAKRALLGLVLGVSVGVVLALVAGLSRFGEAVIDGPVQIKRAIPALAIIPLLILWLGIGEEMKVITIALGVFVPIYLQTHAGLRAHRVEVRRARADRRPQSLGVPAAGRHPRHAPALPARPAVRGHRRLAGPGGRRAGQRHQRHRLHDGARPELRPDRRDPRRPRGLRAARSGLRRRCPTPPAKGTGMADHDGRLTGRPRRHGRQPGGHRPLVTVEHLIRGYGPKGVLNGVDLEIERGEFVALLGPSGCGKSTLLRALAGLDARVSGSGRIRVPGKVSVVFQDSRLLPWANLITNVTLGQRKARAGAGERGPGRGRAGGPRDGLAAPALRRRAAAGRAGPVPGPRARAAPGRRAVRSARRPDPAEDARAAPQPPQGPSTRGAAGHPRRRRGDHPGRPGGRPVARAGSPSNGGSSSPTTATRRPATSDASAASCSTPSAYAVRVAAADPPTRETTRDRATA